MIDQAALAIERVHLVEDMDRAKRTIETDRLRSALLTSISHDLKTPLAAVLGAAGTLRDLAGALTDGEKADLLATIIDESERLNRFIANLLDMTKLESGAVVPNTALHDLGEIVGSALRRAGKILARASGRAGACRRPADAGAGRRPVRAGRCSTCWTMPPNTRPPARTIRIQSWRDQDAICLQVLDEGDGIPPGDLEHIFDKFYRAEKGDQVRAGTGLGLAISRGFVEAMHGDDHGGQSYRSARRGASRSGCRSRRRPSNWTPPHERRSAQGAGRR